jgi:hypothetical protein
LEMAEFSERAARLVIEDGIKRPLRLLLDQRCFAAAVVVTYSGMDTMAYLNMPERKQDVMRSDFIAWANKFMDFGDRHVTGTDLYGTRCSVLHGGAPSRFTREGRGRMLTHGGNAAAHIPVDRLVEAFFRGVDRFLTDTRADPKVAVAVNRRLEALVESGLYDVRDLKDGREFTPSFAL